MPSEAPCVRGPVVTKMAAGLSLAGCVEIGVSGARRPRRRPRRIGGVFLGRNPSRADALLKASLGAAWSRGAERSRCSRRAAAAPGREAFRGGPGARGSGRMARQAFAAKSGDPHTAPHEAAGGSRFAELAREAAHCARCPLYQHATQTVFGEGPASAALMIVGEQPGDKEDLAGRPFVGPAGMVLDRALLAIGLERGSIYLTNAVKHFKSEPHGRGRSAKPPIGARSQRAAGGLTGRWRRPRRVSSSRSAQRGVCADGAHGGAGARARSPAAVVERVRRHGDDPSIGNFRCSTRRRVGKCSLILSTISAGRSVCSRRRAFRSRPSSPFDERHP